jgi:FtsH-binding integral membrane protein
MGWLTVVAYAAASWLCFHLRSRCSPPADALQRKERAYWGFLSLVLLFLCINKQLDLQTAATELFRGLARRQGWYEHRRALQVAFIGTLLLGLSIGGAVLFAVARKLPRATRWAAGGLVVIAVFVLVRAASFHNIDRLLGERLLHFKLNWILELGGIAMVLAAGVRRARDLR